MPKTLVAIPTFNAEEFLHRSIDSCLKQTLVPEIWVVDNQSTDSTQNIVKSYHKKNDVVKLFVNEKNLGRIGNWNRCLDLFEESSFEFVKFLFMGDELLPNCIEKLEEIIHRYPNLMSISWPYYFRNRKGTETLSPKESPYSRIFSKEQLVEAGLFPGNFLGGIIQVAISKSAIKDNRFDDIFLGIVTFYDRISIRGNSYYYVQPLSRFNLDSHRTYKQSLSYDMVLEVSYAKARDLELNKDWIPQKHYQKIKENILTESIRRQLPYFTNVFWLKLYSKLFFYLLKKQLSMINNMVKRIIVNFLL